MVSEVQSIAHSQGVVPCPFPLPVASHYPVCLENQVVGATADPGCGSPEAGLGSGLAVAIAACWRHSPPTVCCTFIFLLRVLIRLLRAACKSRDGPVLENLALRQQVTALKLGKHSRAARVPARKSSRNCRFLWGMEAEIRKPDTDKARRTLAAQGRQWFCDRN